MVRFWRGLFNLLSSVPGVKIPSRGPGLAGSVPATGRGCSSDGWSRQCWRAASANRASTSRGGKPLLLLPQPGLYFNWGLV